MLRSASIWCKFAPFSSSSMLRGSTFPVRSSQATLAYGWDSRVGSLRTPSLRRQLVHSTGPYARRSRTQRLTHRWLEGAVEGFAHAAQVVADAAHHTGSASGSQRPPARRRRRYPRCGARRRGAETFGLWRLGRQDTCAWCPFLDRLMTFLEEGPSPLGCMWRHGGLFGFG